MNDNAYERMGPVLDRFQEARFTCWSILPRTRLDFAAQIATLYFLSGGRAVFVFQTPERECIVAIGLGNPLRTAIPIRAGEWLWGSVVPLPGN
jgi:hypothetical protein